VILKKEIKSKIGRKIKAVQLKNLEQRAPKLTLPMHFKILVVGLELLVLVLCSRHVKLESAEHSLSTGSKDNSYSGSSSVSTEPELIIDHYSNSSSEESTDEERSMFCCLSENSNGGCQKLLSLRSSPAKTGLMMVGDVLLTAGFSAALLTIDMLLGRYCGRNRVNSGQIVGECYPSLQGALLGSIVGIEPVHIVLDVMLFSYAVVFALFGRKDSNPDRWDGLLAVLAGCAMIARILGTIATIFTLPAFINDTTTAGQFSSLLQTAAGTFMGTQFSFLLLMLAFTSRDIFHRYKQHFE